MLITFKTAPYLDLSKCQSNLAQSLPFILAKGISEELLEAVACWQGDFSSSVGAWEADTLDKQKDLTFSPSMYKYYVLFKVFLSQCWVINRLLLCMLNMPTNFEALEEDCSYELAQYFPSMALHTFMRAIWGCCTPLPWVQVTWCCLCASHMGS